MKDLLLILLHLAVTTAKVCGPGGVRAVIGENLLLKPQLIVLRRARQRAPNLTLSDRLIRGFGSLFLSPGRIRKVAIGVRPSTLLAFHQALVRRKYRRLFSPSPCPKKPGPKGPSEALIQAIVEIKSRNPRFGCPRIPHHLADVRGRHRQERRVPRAGETLSPHTGGTGPSWLSFIASRGRRWPSLCRMFNAAIHGRGAPRHLSTDHDPLFEAHRWTANLRILEIDEIKTVPRAPISRPFVDRVIGTILREFLDHVLFWNARDLERKLADFQTYYHAARSHASLEGHTPLTVASGHTVARAERNKVRWVSHCRDLVQLPVAA